MTTKVAIISTIALSGCAALSAIAPTLGTILSRIDVRRVLECSELKPDKWAVARCVGASAPSDALEQAFEDALSLADEAQAAGAGAADGRDAKRLARDLDKALDRLAAEIDAQ